MAWVAFPTLTDGQVLTGAHMQIIRDDFNETANGKFTAAGQIFVATGANTGAARTPSSDYYSSGTGADSTNSTTYIAMGGGPVVSVFSGSSAIVWHSCQLSNDTAGSRTLSTVEVNPGGAGNIAPSDLNAVAYDENTTPRIVRAGVAIMYNTLTPGSNTFAQRGRVSGNTGTLINRSTIVLPL